MKKVWLFLIILTVPLAVAVLEEGPTFEEMSVDDISLMIEDNPTHEDAIYYLLENLDEEKSLDIIEENPESLKQNPELFAAYEKKLESPGLLSEYPDAANTILEKYKATSTKVSFDDETKAFLKDGVLVNPPHFNRPC